MAKAGSNTALKQPTQRRRGPGKKFEKNDPKTGKKDPRINRKGRPRSADALKEMILDVLEEQTVSVDTKKSETLLRNMLLTMALRGAPADRAELLNRAFGKVADEIFLSYTDIQKIINFLPSDMVDRLAKGESIGNVLISYIASLSDGSAETAKRSK